MKNTGQMVLQLFAQRYQVSRQLGEGGMGVVFEAEDTLLKKRVAIKTIRKGLFNAEHIIRFQREATALAGLNHPNLVPVYVFGLTDDNEPYMVMNYEKGKALSEIIKGRGRFPLYKSLGIFIQICDAIQYAHDHNILHRDLKPSNIIVRETESESPSIVVLDFGLAMIAAGDAIDSLTKTGMIVGTPTCMSPEQIRGHEVDRRSDVYAMGCLMFETLTGKPPYTAPSPLELLNLKLNHPPPRITDVEPNLNLPRGISEIVAKALSPAAGDRYQSMNDLKQDLIAFKSGGYKTRDLEQPQAHAQPQQMNKDVRKSALFLGLLLLAICALTVIPFMLFFHHISGEHDQLSALEKSKMDEHQSVKTIDLTIDAVLNRNTKLQVENGMVFTNDSYDDEKVAKFLNSYLGTIKGIHLCGGNVSGSCFGKLRKPEAITLIVTRSAYITDDGLKTISALPSLADLQLNDEALVTPKGISYLTKMPRLSVFGFIGYGLTPAHVDEIAKLHSVNYLILANTPSITDALIPKIASIRSMRRVYLGGTRVTDEGVKTLVRLRPDLTHLCVNKLTLTDASCAQIAKLKHIYRLDIRNNNRITDRGLMMLESMKSMKELVIDDSIGTEFGRSQFARRRPEVAIKVNYAIKEAAAELSRIRIGAN